MNNISYGLKYFERNGFVFVIKQQKIDNNTLIIKIEKFTDIDKSMEACNRYPQGRFTNETEARVLGWYDE